MSGEGMVDQGREHWEGGEEKTSPLLGNVREYGEGYKEGRSGLRERTKPEL